MCGCCAPSLRRPCHDDPSPPCPRGPDRAGAAGAAGFAGFVLIEPYRQSRLVNYLSVLLNPGTADYQAKQSLYALADGGLLGVGITNSKQKFFHLPEHHTDFIFAIVGEELGFIGAAILIVLLFILSCIIIQIALEAKNKFNWKNPTKLKDIIKIKNSFKKIIYQYT